MLPSGPPVTVFVTNLFQGLKIDDRQTRWDYIHDENMRRGEDKYSTLQKVMPTFVRFSIVRHKSENVC